MICSADHSLLHLLSTVTAEDVWDGLQSLSGVIHKLLLQGPFFRAVGPGEPFIQVEQTIETHREYKNPPSHRAPHLSKNAITKLNCVYSRMFLDVLTDMKSFKSNISNHSSSDQHAHWCSGSERDQSCCHGDSQLVLGLGLSRGRGDLCTKHITSL